MIPNQDQVIGILRILIPMALAWFVGKGFITNEAAGDIATALVALAAAVWSAWSHTHAATVGKVAAMAGTEVTKHGAIIEILDPELAKAAQANATNVKGKP